MPYSFDSGTSAAFKQVRTKAQIAGAGALNFICDEIGTNILANQELFAVGLEAYDKGKIKQKITKNTAENTRAEERDEPVPTNMMLFGTPSKLFNGGKEEQEFMSLLETGYARRMFYGVGSKSSANRKLTPEEVFDMLTDSSSEQDVIDLSEYFGRLADRVNYNVRIKMSREVSIELIRYRMFCEERADEMPDHEEVRKAEMQHRYFKVLKLASAYAFVDSASALTKDHIHNAIKLAEESGDAFKKLLNRDKPYVKLAKYIATCDREVTHADLVETLPFYRGSQAVKNEMISLATSWGYSNNIIIKKSYIDNIEMFKGESLKETNLDEMILSYSNHEAYNYQPTVAKFSLLHKLTQVPGLHWCNHSFNNNHRKEENVREGFNMVVIDIDGECQLDTAKELMKDYTCMFYTTKRHTEETNRFRVIIPIKYHLKLTAKDFKEFMANLFEWLPFSSDEQTNQRSKKWLSHDGSYCYNEGDILDPTAFIPKTQRNENRKKDMKALGSMDNIERWFAHEMVEGQRNNTMAKFAFMLLDGGMDPDDVETKVIAFNNKLSDKLTEDELRNTVLKSMWGRVGS